MELKDVILSTLAEMDQTAEEDKTSDTKGETTGELQSSASENSVSSIEENVPTAEVRSSERDLTDEAKYLESIKERLLVLFEGFQSPNNSQIEAKIDLTLNFLEYLLSTIDSRLEILKNADKK